MGVCVGNSDCVVMIQFKCKTRVYIYKYGKSPTDLTTTQFDFSFQLCTQEKLFLCTHTQIHIMYIHLLAIP